MFFIICLLKNISFRERKIVVDYLNFVSFSKEWYEAELHIKFKQFVSRTLYLRVDNTGYRYWIQTRSASCNCIIVLSTIALLSPDKQWTEFARAFIVANERRELSFIDSLWILGMVYKLQQSDRINLQA